MTESSFYEGVYQAFQEYEQEIDDIVEETGLKRDQISRCKDCGESVEEGAVILFPVKNNVVTVQCGACGTVYDEWREDMTPSCSDCGDLPKHEVRTSSGRGHDRLLELGS